MADQTNPQTTETKPAVLSVEAPKVSVEPAKVTAPATAPTAKTATRAPKAKAAPRAAKTTRTKSAKKKPAVRTAKPAAKAAAKSVRVARKAARTVETGVKTMANTTTRKTAEAGKIATEQFNAVLGDVNARAKTALEKSAQVVEQIADLTRGNVEAIVASSKLAAKGVETLSKDAADYSRKSFEDASAAFKSFSQVKSPTDLFKLQGDFARSAFDAAVAETARLSETVLKLANDVAEPINSRYAVAAERVKTLAA